MRPLLLLLLVTACSGDDGDGGDGGDNEEAVASITVTGPGELAVGDSADFTAEARDAGGTVLSDVRFTWGSDRPDVATVDDDGTVRALVPGSASISASAGGERGIYIASEDGGTLGEAVATLSDYTRPLGIRWLPDGSGFLIAAQDRTEIGDGVYVATDQSNLYELRFEDGSVTPLTALENEFVRRFTISPDLQWVVFERVSGGTVWDVDTAPSDLWIVRRDGTEAPRLLVEDAGNPDWNPAR